MINIFLNERFPIFQTQLIVLGQDTFQFFPQITLTIFSCKTLNMFHFIFTLIGFTQYMLEYIFRIKTSIKPNCFGFGHITLNDC